MSRRPLSAVVIACNEAGRLRTCLESLDFADEILVVDSGSSDGTVALAETLGARVIHREWLGYGAQKEFAVMQAAHEWVLCVDADEWVSDPLRHSIEAVLADPGADAYRMRRRNRFMGRWLRHGEGYPDWSLRLFDRRHAGWSDDPVHEKVVARGAVGDLEGDLMHTSEDGLAHYLAKQNRYTTLQAESLHRKGRRTGALQLVASPVLRFVKFYILRRGFLDGVPGLVHVAIGCFNSFCKYAKLREMQQSGAGKGRERP